LNVLLDDLSKKILLKDYEYKDDTPYITITIDNLGYNSIILNEVKRRYMLEGWGGVYWKTSILLSDKILCQLYFPKQGGTL
jgi:hypothetical protein